MSVGPLFADETGPAEQGTETQIEADARTEGGGKADGASDDAAAGEEIVYTLITLGDQAIGLTTTALRETESRRFIRETMQMQVNRFGQTFEMSSTTNIVDRLDGQIETADLQMLNNGTVAQKLSAVREPAAASGGSELVVTQKVAGQDKVTRLPLPEGVVSSYELAQRMEEPLEEGEVRTFTTVSLETLSTPTVTCTGLGEVEVEDRDGTLQRWIGTKVERSDLPIATNVYTMPDGEGGWELARVDLGVLGMVGWPTTLEDAAAALDRSTADLGFATVVRANLGPALHDQKQAKLLVKGLASDLPSSVDQIVEPIGDAAALQVTRRRVDPRWFPGRGEAEPAATASTRFLDYEDETVQQLLAAAPQGGENVGQAAAELAAFVRESIDTVSYGVGFATASETCRSREGDCSEHAVLLAALLRARGIPSRVAFGLVYVGRDQTYVPHMWSEARLTTPKGTSVWVPLDATRPTRPVGAGYLTFGHSLLESDAPLAILELIELSQSLGTLSVEPVAAAGSEAAEGR